ncbi:hypothetical protein Ddye_011500 [Dipteronia dyeriana]|uniref:AtPDCT1/2 transmembrane domain-containing protein n=1 Tax=Dipteronia dyeriana TaxID=168575 RepID=A0AAD9X2M7_9ROSI|nr:hypothetical protein Ddye_011500 [Dipteronia dyeriana]
MAATATATATTTSATQLSSRSKRSSTLNNSNNNDNNNNKKDKSLSNGVNGDRQAMAGKKWCNDVDNGGGSFCWNASFIYWTLEDVQHVARYHWMPCVFAVGLLFFMAVEYTLRMVPASSPPFDLGFVATLSLHRVLASWPELNTLLAALNTVFVGMQTTYIVWVWLIEGRPRATISALFMFTCRGILGYSTQLPLPQGFLGSGADFPVGNVSFFLFFSGHVAGSVIASLDMRRMQRWEMAWLFDVLNVLQAIRLLGTRGHYTIDLAVGFGAGYLFDSLAGKYEKSKRREALSHKEALIT